MYQSEYSVVSHGSTVNKAGIVQLDFDLSIVFCNDVASGLFDAGAVSLAGLSLPDILPSYYNSPVNEKITVAISSKQEVGFDMPWHYGADEVYCFITPTINGVLMQLYPLAFGRLEQRLHDQIDYLNRIATTLPDMVSVFELRTRKLIYTNTAPYVAQGFDYQKMKQMEPSERLRSFLHPDDVEPTGNYFKAFETLGQDDVQMLEYRAKNDHDEWQWYKTRGKVFMFDDNNKPTHCINVVQNISARKTVEESIRKNLAIMQQAEEIALLGSWEYDLVTKQFLLSAGMYELFAINEKDVVKPDIYLQFAIEEDKDIAREIVESISIHHTAFDRTLRICINNQVKVIKLKVIPGEKDNYRTARMLGVNMDVTDIIRAENDLKILNASLNERNRELEEKNEELSAFAFIASHDLKEPLRKIHTFSSWLMDKELVNLSEQGRAYLLRMQNSVARMDLLINDILTLLRLEDKQQELESIDLSQVVKKCLEEFDSEIAETGASITSDDLPVIKGYSSLSYLFNNLVGNSLKFRHKNRKPSITISSKFVDRDSIVHPGHQLASRFVVLSFADNGIGFEEKYSKLIFQMFQRLHGKTEYAGTGIGLAICKKVVEIHEGFIVAESVLGEGSIFHCYLPVI